MSFLHQVIFRKALTDYARRYLQPQVGTIVDITINYVLSFGVFATDLQIRNLDAAAIMQYSINSRDNLETIPAGGTQGVDNILVETIRIVGNAATGSWELSHVGIPFELLVPSP